MRRLNRRLLRWHRYAHRTYWNPRVTSPRWLLPRSAVLCSPGHTRAWDAQQKEQERRFWDETPEIWLGGPEGEQALIADVLDDEARRIAEHENACWQGCDDLHYCQDCGHHGCEGDCEESYDEPDDDAGHGDDWPHIETATVERGLL